MMEGESADGSSMEFEHIDGETEAPPPHPRSRGRGKKDRPKPKPFVFTPDIREMFLSLYHSYDEGRFKSLLNDKDPKLNLVKAQAWEEFAEEFNRYAGTQLTSRQLQDFRSRLAKIGLILKRGTEAAHLPGAEELLGEVGDGTPTQGSKRANSSPDPTTCDVSPGSDNQDLSEVTPKRAKTDSERQSGGHVFTAEMKQLFLDLYNTHNDGSFQALINDPDPTKNMLKNTVWDSFREEYNRESGSNLTCRQLKDFRFRLIKESLLPKSSLKRKRVFLQQQNPPQKKAGSTSVKPAGARQILHKPVVLGYLFPLSDPAMDNSGPASNSASEDTNHVFVKQEQDDGNSADVLDHGWPSDDYNEVEPQANNDHAPSDGDHNHTGSGDENASDELGSTEGESDAVDDDASVPIQHCHDGQRRRANAKNDLASLELSVYEDTDEDDGADYADHADDGSKPAHLGGTKSLYEQRAVALYQIARKSRQLKARLEHRKLQLECLKLQQEVKAKAAEAAYWHQKRLDEAVQRRGLPFPDIIQPDELTNS